MSGAVIDSRVIARVRRFAEDPAHWYRPELAWCQPGADVPEHLIPGNIPGHVAELGPCRAVFSWSQNPGDRLMARHLSISGSGPGLYPSPAAAFAVATLFGFTGGEPSGSPVTLRPGADWYMGQGGLWEGRGVIIIGQPIPAVELGSVVA